MRKKTLSRALAMAASLVLCASMAAAPVYAADSQEKEETVYVKADAEGNTQTVIVSDWLKNKKKAAEIKDATDLNDIENVKGDETFQKGSKTASPGMPTAMTSIIRERPTKNFRSPCR